MFSIRWLPVNQAWAILFGNDPRTATVLKICNSKAEAEDILDSWENS